MAGLCFAAFASVSALAQAPEPKDSSELYYASVHVGLSDGWSVKDQKLFSGTVPSKAWILSERSGSEAIVGALVTEGVEGGLRDQATTILIKSYVEALAVSWGATTVKGDNGGERAAYCQGEAGYHLEASFGTLVFDYYGCMVMREDKWRAATIVTWVKRDGGADPEATALVEASKRLIPLVKAVRFDPPVE